MLGRFTKKPLELVQATKFPHQIELRATPRRAALVRFMSDVKTQRSFARHKPHRYKINTVN
jgi:hypothetical protein